MSLALALGALALAYLVGSLPTGLAVIRLVRGIDIRRTGSGNVGAANVYRAAGLPTAVLVLALDAGKGMAGVWLARALGAGLPLQAAAALAAVAGHDWSVFLRLGGGKGVATTFGGLLALSPAAAAGAALVWVAVVAATRYASLGSLAALGAAPLVMWARGEPAAHLGFAAAAALLAVLRHRANIARLLAGRELRLGERRGEETDARGLRA